MMIKLSRAVSGRFWHKWKFENPRNTGCISDFSICTVGTKDPLSAEVDFISVSLWVEGDSFLSACQNKLPCIFSCKIKTGRTFCGSSCKKSLCMTSYGGIIRIRLRVEVRLLPLSLLTQAPLYLFSIWYTLLIQNTSAFFTQIGWITNSGYLTNWKHHM